MAEWVQDSDLGFILILTNSRLFFRETNLNFALNALYEMDTEFQKEYFENIRLTAIFK